MAPIRLVNSAIKECSEPIDYSKETVNAFNNTIFVADNYKCFIKCVFSKLNISVDNKTSLVYDAHSILMLTQLVQSSKRNHTIKALKTCKNVKGFDSCDTAFLFFKCIKNIVNVL